MSEVSTIPVYLFSNETLLHEMLLRPPEETWTQSLREKIEEIVYLEFHRCNSRRPDHVFQNRWEFFLQEYLTEGIPFCLAGLKCLAHEYLEFRGSRLHAKLKEFDWWQTLLSRMSSLPVQAYKMVERWEEFPEKSQGKFFSASSHILLYPHDDVVDDYILRNGLNDTHVHINGCAYGEECWLNALHDPLAEYRKMRKQYREHSQVRELFHQLHVDLTPVVMHSHLKKARSLRGCLLKVARDWEKVCGDVNKKERFWVNWVGRFHDISDGGLDDFSGAPPVRKGMKRCVEEEKCWMMQVIKCLKESGNEWLDQIFLQYLLLQNEFIQLSVQRDDRYGFEQFNKFSMADKSLLDKASYYEECFRNMHGIDLRDSNVLYLDARFSPKACIGDNESQLYHILKAYSYYRKSFLYKQEQRKEMSESNLEEVMGELSRLEKYPHARWIQLALTAHFIKKGWSHKREQCRYGILRRKIFSNFQGLFHTIKRHPKLIDWVRAIDAAASELDTPPEVFAPCFRMCRKYIGIKHITYHCGEDFRHVIGGLRMVWDAVHFLELQGGDRLGHGTALGIDPRIWLDTMPRKIIMTKGDWLITLLFAWNLLRSHPGYHEDVARIESDINEVGYDIFRNHHGSPHILKQVMDLRHLDPFQIRDARNSIPENKENKEPWSWIVPRGICWESAWFPYHQQEAECVYEAIRERSAHVMDMIYDWNFDKELWSRSEKKMEVDAAYLDVGGIITLQQLVMRKICEKTVVVETLPTSNVRISQYAEFSQHHALRWMKVPPFAKEGDPEAMIALGSDDPGIFANDIKADFYHLYNVLRSNGLNDCEALEKLHQLNQRGRQYSFHKKNIFPDEKMRADWI